MRVYRKRRIYTIVVFLAVAGLVFICFQAFSVQVLNLETGEHLIGAQLKNSMARHASLDGSETPWKKAAAAGKVQSGPGGGKGLSRSRRAEIKGEPREGRGRIEIVKGLEKGLTKEERKAQKDALAQVIDDVRAEQQQGAIGHAANNGRKADEDVGYAGDPAEFHPRMAAGKSRQQAAAAVGAVKLAEQKGHTGEDGEEEDIPDKKKRPRGVPLHWAHLYRPDGQGMFSCLESREKIKFKRVNDDYCDCSDGTDEPGTSACENGRFYCHFQVENAPKWLPSNRVNDGICDCCDGSDEWDTPVLPSHVALDNKKPAYGIYQSPCVDRCQALREEMRRKKEIQSHGLKVKQQYIQESKGKANPGKIYGEHGEYMPLSESCFVARAGKYTYVVCPFKEVRQEELDGKVKIIGRAPGMWITTIPGVQRLQMGKGDGTQCPGLKSRLAMLDFSCGLNNTVLSVQETEICEYTIQFESPAAC